MQEYNNGITDTLARNTRRQIASLPQPTMFGGKRARVHPKAGTTQYDYPGTLAVGRFSQTPRLLGAGFWQDFGKGFKQGAVGTAKVVAPIAGELAKDAALSYIRGGKRKKYTLGSFAKDLGDVAQPFKEQVVPVATGVAKEVARDAIKSYLKGGALIKNRPQEFHSDIYPQALASYRPQDSHMFGGDMAYYWKFVKDYKAKHPELTIGEIRQRIRDGQPEPKYKPEARKPRPKKTAKDIVADAFETDPEGAAALLETIMETPAKAKKSKAIAAAKKLTAGSMYDSDSDSDDEMYGGDMAYYWQAVKKLAAADGISLKKARELITTAIKEKKFEIYKPEARKPRKEKGLPKRVTIRAGAMSGGRGVLDDLVKVSKAAAPYVPLMMMAAGRKKKKMTGGKGIADDIAKIAKAGEAYIPLARQAMMGGRKQLPRSGHKREVARGDIVAAVMRQQGISLPAASRYVKDNGLY